MNCVLANKVGGVISSLGRPFYFLWCGEIFSIFGLAIMEFSLGVWVYQETLSVMSFSGIIAASMVPAIITLPFAGKVADSFDRQYIMILSDFFTAILIIILAFLLWKNSLIVQHLYFFNALAALVGSFRSSAYIVSVSQLLPQEKYIQANGLVGITSNLIAITAPIVAGWLMVNIGLSGVLCIDLISFCLGSIFIFHAFFRWNKKNRQTIKNNRITGNRVALTKLFFLKQKTIGGLFFYVILLSALFSLASIMVMPMILSNYNASDLGMVISFGAIGGLVSAIVLAIINSPGNLALIILIGDAIMSLFIIIIGFTTNLTLYCLCAFMIIFIATLTKGCMNSLLMKKIPLEYRGRVFSILNAITLSTTLVVLLGGAWVSENVFGPLLKATDLLPKVVYLWIGDNKGRELGLMFMISGLLGFFVSLYAFSTPLRNLDSEEKLTT